MWRAAELRRFLELVRAQQVEHGSALIIENIDRLSRQAVFKSLSLLVELVNAGVEVHTLGDGRNLQYRYQRRRPGSYR